MSVPYPAVIFGYQNVYINYKQSVKVWRYDDSDMNGRQQCMKITIITKSGISIHKNVLIEWKHIL